MPPVPISGSPASAGSLLLDPVFREYLLMRWRACATEMSMIAPILHFEDRLPKKKGERPNA